jgi:hypothetical protein
MVGFKDNALLISWFEVLEVKTCAHFEAKAPGTYVIKSRVDTPWPQSIYLDFTLLVALVSTLRFDLILREEIVFKSDPPKFFSDPPSLSGKSDSKNKVDPTLTFCCKVA